MATNRPAIMLIYQYDVAGVSYEASRTSLIFGSGSICIPVGSDCPPR